MLLGIVINDKGLVPATDVERINEYGKEINKQYASPYKQPSGKGFKLTINFDNPTSIDRVVIQEDIKKGERVLDYTLEGKINGKWINLTNGTNIGHKRIERFSPHLLDAIRLEISRAKDTPYISNFAVFETIM